MILLEETARSIPTFVFMFIYNVTVNISEEAHNDWLEWMRTVHIADVLKTGCFTDARMLKVLHVSDEGQTYSIQYRFEKMDNIEDYMQNYAQALQAEHKARYGESYTAFRTLLEEI
jgi:hypothetical protein